MRSLFLVCAFVSAADFARAHDSVCSHPAAEPVLELVWSGRGEAAATIRPLIEEELGCLLDEIGLKAKWIVWDGRERESNDQELHITALEEPPASVPRGTMGATLAGTRRTWIYLGSIERALRPDRNPSRPPPGRASRALARAAARVIAHELGHVSAPERRHAHKGLMAATLDRQFLSRPALRLGSDLGRSLQRAAFCPPADAPQVAGTVRLPR